MGVGRRATLLLALLTACTRTVQTRPTDPPPERAAAPSCPESAPAAEPAAVAEEPPPPPTPPEVAAMVAARAALRPFEYTGEQEIPAETRALFAQMRARTLAWIVAVMGEAAHGELDPNAAAIRARLTGPTERAGVGPFPLFDQEGDGDDVAYGSLVRLDVIEPHDSTEGGIWWVLAAQRVNVTSDTAVYGFRLDTGEAVLAFRFEPPAPSYEAAAFGELALRPLWHASLVRALIQTLHTRSWSRWQSREWAILENTPEAPEARAAWSHSERIDVTGGPGDFDGGPWLDPDGLTVTGESPSMRGSRLWVCSVTARFRWAGDRLVPRFRERRCAPY